MRNEYLRIVFGIVALGFALAGGGAFGAANAAERSTSVGTAASVPTEELVEKFSSLLDRRRMPKHWSTGCAAERPSS